MRTAPGLLAVSIFALARCGTGSPSAVQAPGIEPHPAGPAVESVPRLRAPPDEPPAAPLPDRFFDDLPPFDGAPAPLAKAAPGLEPASPLCRLAPRFGWIAPHCA